MPESGPSARGRKSYGLNARALVRLVNNRRPAVVAPEQAGGEEVIEMGAVLISRNELSALEPNLALWIEEAVARAVARFPATFRASIECVRGESTVQIRIEEHRGAQPHPVHELRIDPRWNSEEIRRRVEKALRRNEDAAVAAAP
jgi:hypothetical protein